MLRILFLMLLTFPAYAQDAPTAASKKKALQAVESELKSKQQDLKSLKEKSKSLQSELKSTRSDLVDLAEQVKNNESALLSLEKQIQSHEKEKTALIAKLEEDKSGVSSLILALERIQRIPPEALILKPGAPYETAQSAMLLQSLLPLIYERTENLKKDTARLESLVSKLKQDKQTVAAEKASLDKKYASVESLLKKRESIFKQTNKDHKTRTAEVKQISAQAVSLKDLVQKLEDDKTREETRAVTRRAIYQQPERLPKSGKGQLPASGTIAINYGETDDIGAQSQGIHLETRRGAIIVSPMSGKVQFAGFFKNYGQLIILQHEKGYHSLIAGMDRIDIVVDQVVRSGEPIGRMQSRTENGSAPVLYYELRHKGKPINPSKRIVNLRS